MSEIRNYRDLIGWQKAMALITDIYKLSARFPADERFGLTSQVRRAGVSIAANIAEGFGRSTRANYVRFPDMACGSANEAETHLLIARQLGYIQQTPVHDIIEKTIEVRKIVKGLIRSIGKANHASVRSETRRDKPMPEEP